MCDVKLRYTYIAIYHHYTYNNIIHAVILYCSELNNYTNLLSNNYNSDD